jgi:hypothetical protein
MKVNAEFDWFLSLGGRKTPSTFSGAFESASIASRFEKRGIYRYASKK